MNITRIRKIEEAKSFKVEFMTLKEVCGSHNIESREFKSIKSLSQWVERNEAGHVYFELNRFALIDDIWEPYTTIGKTTITLHALKCIVRRLEDDSLKTSKSKK